jgi:hypothetical protein
MDILSVENIENLLLENDLNDDKVLDLLRVKVASENIDISNGDLQGVVEIILQRLKVKIKNAN